MTKPSQAQERFHNISAVIRKQRDKAVVTTPTQAQIEVGRFCDKCPAPHQCAEEQECLLEQFTAAAQVGEQRPEPWGDRLRAERELTFLTTIERCAQVCDEAANDPRATEEYRYFCINMAAAIRKLGHET